MLAAMQTDAWLSQKACVCYCPWEIVSPIKHTIGCTHARCARVAVAGLHLHTLLF